MAGFLILRNGVLAEERPAGRSRLAPLCRDVDDAVRRFRSIECRCGGPLRISMFSISSGLMSSKRDERVALPVVASEFTLMPSTYTTGALPSDSDDAPRMRILVPPPAAPAEMI